MLDLSFIHAAPFYELTALVVLAAVIGFVGVLLRQPMIVSFIAAGVVAGPSMINIVQSNEHITHLLARRVRNRRSTVFGGAQTRS